MKNIFTISLSLALSFLCLTTATSQVIRKNYREMTTMEKQLFVDAVTALGPPATSGTGKVLNEYATNHDLLSDESIHRDNDFLPWHRWFILYFEKELQKTTVTGSNKIVLPYWDWTSEYYTSAPTDQDKSAPLWGATFLGPLNTSWSLGRTASTIEVFGPSSQLQSILLGTDLTNFRIALEQGFHNTGHRWVGGTNGEMALRRSPRDPVFYLHHCMVDKVWQDWQNFGRISSFSEQNMPNTVPPGATRFPTNVPTTVTPTSIIDSRAASVKVWYAENGKVILDKYTVTGTENYHYTGIIEAGTRLVTSKGLSNGSTIISTNYLTGTFTVPSGTVCNFTSGGLQMGSAPAAGYIRLVPGFTAASGSTFTAKINSTYFTNASAGGRIAAVDNGLTIPVDGITVFPNPSNGNFTISLEDKNITAFSYEIKNLFGFPVASGESNNNAKTINITNLQSGVYVVTILTASGEILTERVIIN